MKQRYHVFKEDENSWCVIDDITKQKILPTFCEDIAFKFAENLNLVNNRGRNTKKTFDIQMFKNNKYVPRATVVISTISAVWNVIVDIPIKQLPQYKFYIDLVGGQDVCSAYETEEEAEAARQQLIDMINSK